MNRQLPPDTRALESAVRRGAARILLAEDNPVNQEAAIGMLELAGLQVDVANNGHEAVVLARDTHYDLVLMDLQMPVLDGLAATRELRAMPRTARTPIVAMTTHADDTSQAACRDIGMNDYLSKPVDPQRLYAVLAQYLSCDVVAAEAPPDDAAVFELPGLNTRRGLVFFAGDLRVYEQALGQFVDLYGSGIAAIDAALATRSVPRSASGVDTLRRALHSVGGASTAIGAEPLHQQATALEHQLGGAPRDEPFALGLAVFQRDLAGLVAALRTHLARTNAHTNARTK